MHENDDEAQDFSGVPVLPSFSITNFTAVFGAACAPQVVTWDVGKAQLARARQLCTEELVQVGEATRFLGR